MFERNIHTYTIKEQLQLHKAKAVVIGIGGGGCSMSEILARTGIGNITLVDFDTFESSNKNRQLGALESTLTKPKVLVMKNRILDINPACMVTAVYDSINQNNYVDILKDKDIILDAVDKVKNKILVGKFVKDLNKTYTTGGLGGYNYWCATLKEHTVQEIFSITNADNDVDEIPNYPCASGVIGQAALQSQQAINYYLGRKQNSLDKIIKVNQMNLYMSVGDIE